MKSAICNFCNSSKFYLAIFFVTVIIFWKLFFQGLIPLSADTIVGMYHPWRDYFAKDYPNGIPFNNPLITDPVRQQFVWKKLVIDYYKNGVLPVENPYSFSGYPLLANFQSGAFYPLNLLFFILPLNYAWAMYIFSQFFLGGLFMFWYLRSEGEVSHHDLIAFMGSTAWILAGFWISWAEWGNILHTALWLPLVLLSIDKVLDVFCRGTARRAPTKTEILWFSIYLFSLCFSFFAGHLQTFFYLYVFSLFYFFHQLRTANYKLRILTLFLIFNSVFLFLTSVQWYPTLNFIATSARNFDVQNILTRPDWFIPIQHLIQLFIPDYFGNPAKGNYWGVWNYGEYLSYIGILPIFFAIYGIIASIKGGQNKFWTAALFFILLFSLRNPVSEILYRLQIPFFMTAQPSRLIFLLDFVLIVLAISHINQLKSFHVLKRESCIFLLLLLALAGVSLVKADQQTVILRNSLPPMAVFILFLLFSFFVKNKNIVLVFIFLLTLFDQARVFWRYNTFSPQTYIFPETKTILFLQNKLKTGFFRIASLNREIMPPNFSTYYRIPDIGGYDPLYPASYARLISHGSPAGFNRIIQLDAPDPQLFNELKVKYVLTFADLPSARYKLVLIEGKTKTYEYLNL